MKESSESKQAGWPSAISSNVGVNNELKKQVIMPTMRHSALPTKERINDESFDSESDDDIPKNNKRGQVENVLPSKSNLETLKIYVLEIFRNFRALISWENFIDHILWLTENATLRLKVFVVISYFCIILFPSQIPIFIHITSLRISFI